MRTSSLTGDLGAYAGSRGGQTREEQTLSIRSICCELNATFMSRPPDSRLDDYQRQTETPLRGGLKDRRGNRKISFTYAPLEVTTEDGEK
jgi:hypothetical protein